LGLVGAGKSGHESAWLVGAVRTEWRGSGRRWGVGEV
jgi:hypothetical protein